MGVERLVHVAALRMRSMFRGRRLDLELDEELEFHLDHKIEELVAQGLAPEEARRAAVRSLGGLARRKEECRDARGVNAVENIARDIRYGLRALAKTPVFTAVALITVTMAIAANAVVFGVLDTLVLRPLNVPDGGRLWGTQYGQTPGWQSYPNYRDLRDRNRSFEDLAAFSFVFAALDLRSNPTPASGYSATGNYFDVLGVRPHLGRFFHPSDELGPNSAPYVVLSYAFWHNQLAGDRTVIGRTVYLNKHPYTVIGVAPPEFRGTVMFVSPDFFVPMVNVEQLAGERILDVRGTTDAVFEVFGRLKPGVTPEQASADVNAAGAYLEKTYPKEFAYKPVTLARPGLASFRGPVQAFVGGLMVLAGLILLAACANLGGLFGARAAERSREVALRLALGSSGARIVRQLLTEALLVALAGGAAGVIASLVLLRALSNWQPFPGTPVHLSFAPGWPLYLVAAALAVASGLLFGSVPARQALRSDPYQVVKAGATGAPSRRITTRDFLLAAQIAICAVLVTSSMVAIRGLVRSLQTDFGFEPRQTLLVGVDLARAGYSAAQAPETQKQLIHKLAAIPGVEHVGLVNRYPPLVYGAASRFPVFKEDAAARTPADAAARPFRFEVSPGYFAAAGTALLTGRSFGWQDDRNAPRVAVVNQVFAKLLFGSPAAAIGRRFDLQGGTRLQIIGVTEDGKYHNLAEGQQPAMFLSALQFPSSAAYLIVRSTRDEPHIAAAIRSAIREADAGLPANPRTWYSLLEVVLFPSRVATIALGVLGAIGAVLSITGIFGMAAFSVTRRLKELGIRIALGARRTEVLKAALGRALKLLLAGSAAGLLLGILASRVLASVVYQATPRDPLVLAAVVVAMAVVGLLATWVPAQRALSLDPLTLLRED